MRRLPPRTEQNSVRLFCQVSDWLEPYSLWNSFVSFTISTGFSDLDQSLKRLGLNSVREYTEEIYHKRIGYDLNGMRQSACLMINPNTTDSFATLFNCTPIADGSGVSLYDDLDPKVFILVGRDRLLLGLTELN